MHFDYYFLAFIATAFAALVSAIIFARPIGRWMKRRHV
jgi:hypothetical protein